ncbi:sensor histidine kinase [Holophaga foetida]|uniref:sensor histidine kinase n=1 Tax=Holophaga foetida TaxID=35839 RepID=UPI0002474292|nr:histidine kinase [Holophaga foetida]
MRLQDFPTVTLRKFRTPSTWGAIFAYGLFWTALRFMTDLPRGLSLGTEILVPFLLLGGNVALAPLPWLWTGDTRKQAPPLRGFLQCLPWNAIWLLGLTWLLIQMAPMPLGQQQNLHLFLLGRHFVLRPEWGLFFFNYPFALILGWFLADKERAEASERELQILADRTRAQALQAQLNPHVLFNVLGGLTELVHEDPDAAEEALVGLVEMYRDLMKHGTTLRDPLKQERALLKRYLGIEAIRLGERLKVEWAWPDWADALELPPLLLQPLVENAIKHGISTAPEGGTLRVEIHRTPDSLVLRVANTGKPLRADYREGTGLGNLRERLTLMPTYRPTLTLAQEGAWVVAQLALAWRWPA